MIYRGKRYDSLVCGKAFRQPGEIRLRGWQRRRLVAGKRDGRFNAAE